MNFPLPAIGAILALIAGLTFQTPSISRPDLPGVVNYSRVDATVGCAGATDLSAFPALAREGFVSIVNLRLADEPGVDIEQAAAAARQHGLSYFHLPFSASQPDPTIVERFLELVSDEAHQPVYVHCGSANRVGAVWLIKRVLVDKWALDRAVEEAEAIGLRSPELRAFALEYIRENDGAAPRP
jgi:uncharacterized protein (TIGR01244 family)